MHPEECSAFPSYWLGPFSLEVGDVAQRDTCPSAGLLRSQNSYSYADTPPVCLYSWEDESVREEDQKPQLLETHFGNSIKPSTGNVGYV